MGQLSYYAVAGTYTGASTQPSPAQLTSVSSTSLSEQGSFALSSFALAERQTATASTSATGSATETYSGTDTVGSTGGPYSGTQTGSAGSQETSSQSASLSEQGSYAQGSFSLSSVTFSGAGADSFSAQDSSTAGWGGSYAGTGSSSDASAGTLNYSVSAAGSFLAGSWGLASYVLQGTSLGTTSASANQSQSFNHQQDSSAGNQSAVESDSLYQAGTEAAGAYSNTSYSYADTGTASATSSGQAPTGSTGDTWSQQHASTLNLAGTQASSAGATYAFQDAQGGGTLSNSGSGSSTGVALPGALAQLPAPDGSLVPVAGADVQARAQAAGGTEAPVPVVLHLQAWVDAGAWMGSVAQLAAQAVGPAIGPAGSSGQWTWRINGTPAPAWAVGALFGAAEAAGGVLGGVASTNSPPSQGVQLVALPVQVVGGAVAGGWDERIPGLPNPGSYAAQVWNGLRPLFQLLSSWAGGPASAAQGQVQALLGVQVGHMAERPPTTGDALVDWVDGVLYTSSGPLTAGSAWLYGGSGVQAGFALSTSSVWVQLGVEIVAMWWQTGPEMLLTGPAEAAAEGSVWEGELGSQDALASDLRANGALTEAASPAGELLVEDGAQLAKLSSPPPEVDPNEPGGGPGDPTTNAKQDLLGQERDLEKTLANCFPAGTLLTTVAGSRPIETVERGDRVWAYDLVAGEWRPCRVLKTFRRLYRGRSAFVTAAGETVECTFLHPYWVVRGEGLAARPRRPHLPPVPAGATALGRWVDAGDVQVGDELLLRDGRVVAVEGVRHGPYHAEVYNVEVEDLHCYAVGPHGVLMHNINEEEKGANTGPPGEGPTEPQGPAEGEDPADPGVRTTVDPADENLIWREGAPGAPPLSRARIDATRPFNQALSDSGGQPIRVVRTADRRRFIMQGNHRLYGALEDGVDKVQVLEYTPEQWEHWTGMRFREFGSNNPAIGP